MKGLLAIEELGSRLTGFSSAIVYQPLGDEVNLESAFSFFPTFVNILKLPTEKQSDPYTWAQKCMTEFSKNKVCIFVPGRAFDFFGTRHGRGNGWYDRFLSQVPPGWLRIGVADIGQIYKKTLKRNSWDEPMDWLLFFDGRQWRARKTEAKRG